MEKVLLAVGFRQLEEYLEKQLRKEFVFIGNTVYREGIIRAIGQKKPDIVVIRETLSGNENIMSIIYEVRSKYPKTRIVFVAGNRDPGDELLANLVNYGVYDILQGEKIQANQIISLIRQPNEYKDVKHLQPVPILDEQKNRVLFQAPQATEKEIIKEIYLEKESQSEEIVEEKKQFSIEKEKSPKISQPYMDDDNEEDLSIEKDKQKKGFFSKLTEIADVTKIDREEKPKKEEKQKKETKIKETLTSPNINQIENSRQKIITFIGGKGGVGTTSLSLNTAILLAKRNYKVMYIEFNDIMPSASYWYQLGLVDDGIDTCLEALDGNRLDKISDAIISSKSLKEKDSTMKKNYKKLPNSLDFLFFSQHYLANREKIDIDLSTSKELYLHLLFQADYDFVVLDVPYDISNQATVNGLIYSNKIFTVVTQDVCTIGYNLFNLHELESRGINLKKKNNYIVNKFEKTNLSLKEIKEWIGTDNLITVPLANKDFVNSNLMGLPISLYTKNQELKNALTSIEKIIL